jgi:hypothetical protein
MTAATLDGVEYVPRAVLQHLGHQLHFPAPDLATLRGLYRVERTLFAHQAWACADAGFHWPQASDRDAVIDALAEGSSGPLDRARLARHAREALYARRCLIPREREIDDWVRRAVNRVELEDRRQLDVAVAADAGARWLALLMRERYPGPMTVLEWLRRPPPKRSRKTLEEELSKWLTNRAMSSPTNLERIPAQRLRSYARRMCRRRPIKVREIAEPRRTLELAAMLSVSAAGQSDTALRLIEMRIVEIWSWAHAVARPEPHQDLSEDVARELARLMDDPDVSDAINRRLSTRLTRILLPIKAPHWNTSPKTVGDARDPQVVQTSRPQLFAGRELPRRLASC